MLSNCIMLLIKFLLDLPFNISKYKYTSYTLKKTLYHTVYFINNMVLDKVKKIEIIQYIGETKK